MMKGILTINKKEQQNSQGKLMQTNMDELALGIDRLGNRKQHKKAASKSIEKMTKLVMEQAVSELLYLIAFRVCRRRRTAGID